jgi:hypothetical protein
MDPNVLSDVGRLSDDALLAGVKSLARDERRATAVLIAHLAELEERRLYLAEGFSSPFTYCTQVLHLSEHAAYGRIEAARVEELVARLRPQPPVPASVRRLPTVGHAVASIPPDLTISLDAASKRTGGAPGESVMATRSGPSSTSTPPNLLPPTPGTSRARPAVVTPLAPQRFRVQLTASAETVENLRWARFTWSRR